MLDLVLHISGKSNSGKDLYANALRIILNEHYTKVNPVCEPDTCARILAFGESLKYLGADITGLPATWFFDRATKDSEICSRDIRDAVYFLGIRDRVNWKDKTLVTIRAGLPGCPEFPVEANLKVFHDWLFDVRSATPRDILKKLGSDGGVVPSWTWVIAVRTQLEHLHRGVVPHVAIISDTRRLEELFNTYWWCLTRDIPTLRFRLNPWNKTAATGNEHITETELENRLDIKWTDAFSPEEGMTGMVDTLGSMLTHIAPNVQFRNSLYDKIKEREYLTGVLERAAKLV